MGFHSFFFFLNAHDITQRAIHIPVRLVGLGWLRAIQYYWNNSSMWISLILSTCVNNLCKALFQLCSRNWNGIQFLGKTKIKGIMLHSAINQKLYFLILKEQNRGRLVLFSRTLSSKKTKFIPLASLWMWKHFA